MENQRTVAPNLGRKWHFSPRSLVIAPLLLAVILAPFVVGTRKRKLAVDAIIATGGSIKYSEEPRNLGVFRRAAHFLDGLAFGPPVECVALDDVKNVRSVLPYLKDLNAIQLLALSGSDVRDSDLDWIAEIHSLRTVDLHGVALSNDGLRRIAGLRNLEWLSLADTKVTDDGLENLQSMTELKHVALGGCSGINGDGLRFLDGLTKLEELDLEATGVREPGLSHLLRLRNLRILSVVDAPVTRDEVLRFREKVTTLLVIDSGDSNGMVYNDYKNKGFWGSSGQTYCWSPRKGAQLIDIDENELRKRLEELREKEKPNH